MTKIPPVKYMRDFYPEEMRLRQWIEDAWRSASERAGFEPWDSPIVEHLELYTRKSGPEIVGQLYAFKDRGDRDLAIRPEMTPSLARMIAQRQGQLPRPIKWYCMARMCRYERAQRGRLREFWQWNVDVLGAEGPLADAEVLSVALDGLIAMGLTAADIEARINSRSLLAALLLGLGLPTDQHASVFAVIDKRGKVDATEFDRLLSEAGLLETQRSRLKEILLVGDLPELEALVDRLGLRSTSDAALTELKQLLEYLAALGKAEFCRFDMGIVRGLAYYTGPVFEVFDKSAELRAICGGGRYDQLLATMGGQPLPAVGFGMGDVVVAELLKDLGRLPSFAGSVDFYLIGLDDERRPDVLRLTQKFRQQGRRAEYSMRTGKLGAQLKRANEAGARCVVFVGGDEWQRGVLRVKQMDTGAESEIPIEEF